MRQSERTKKIIALLGPVLDILEIVDEIESGLHPEIAKLIIKLFNSSNNKHNAQLIFTTYNTNLLDNELFRRPDLFYFQKSEQRHRIIFFVRLQHSAGLPERQSWRTSFY
ncbi:MAG: hypothetical protein B6U87_00785 [Candidatus Aenigmarchaeota archaeon ex4484_52]|nr:MAG: hypothetical protein B6U87_00785 [Candidatus Aenigmarchaeota archaeon ex4484_52]